MKITALIILLSGCLTSLAFSADPLSRERIEARVEDEILTTTDLERSLRPIYQQYREIYFGAELRRREKATRRDAINNWIEKQLMLKQAAVTPGIAVDPLIVEKKVRQFRGSYTPEQFEKLLIREGWEDEAKYRRFLEKNIKVRILKYRKVGSKVAISPRQIMDYYEEHREDFLVPVRVQVQHIELRAPTTETEKEKVLARARMILEKLDQGEDFGSLARRYSRGPNAGQGGDLGFREKGELGLKLDKIIFSLPVGRHSRIIETSRGYHIVKVTAKRSAGRVSLKDAWPEIEDKLYRQAEEKIFNAWINRLKSQTYYYVTPE